jgi:ATPase family associated with various cellular activities (AAA)
MTPQERWHVANDRYLADALSWLRTATMRLVPGKKARQRKVLPPRLMLTDLQQFDPDRGKAKPTNPKLGAPALSVLAHALGLSEFECKVLFLSAAAEFDADLANLFAKATGETTRGHASFNLGFKLFDEPAWDAMSPERPLRFWRLIEINQPGAQPLTISAIKADERVVNFIKGLNYLDDRISPLVEQAAPDLSSLPLSHKLITEDLRSRMTQQNRHVVFQLVGQDKASKLIIAHALTQQLGLNLYRLSSENVPQANADMETFQRLWQRESLLLPIALYVDCSSIERDAPAAKAIDRFLSRNRGVVFLDVRDAWSEVSYETHISDVMKPTPREQLDAWQIALGENTPNRLPARLSAQFNLNVSDISSLARLAIATTQDPTALQNLLWKNCLAKLRPGLDHLGQTIDAKATWDMLVLPKPETNTLRQIVSQVQDRPEVYDDWGFRERMNRGLGISVLFAGDSGTGKTMAAEVIAKELGLLLYRIDLAGVVSKFIGETEKNLRKVFDAAEDGGAVLFFDEADALFGSRSEVKDSHDRYANIEINYLLQRIESFRGLAILASNMKKSLDQAFLRRLRFIVDFPHPGISERMIMWSKVFPPETPTADLDFARLAKLNLTGGSINNIALNAAFLASRAASAVTMPIIMEAARGEFRKLEKPVNESDFRLLEAVGGVP